MGSFHAIKNGKEKIYQDGLINKLQYIKSKYILKQIFDNLQRWKALEIIKYSKNHQERLDININDYKQYSETLTPIEIEIIPKQNIYSPFINVNKLENESYYHIYFNNNKEEIKRNYIKKKKKSK